MHQWHKVAGDVNKMFIYGKKHVDQDIAG